MTGVTKAMIYAILSGIVHIIIKEHLLLIEKGSGSHSDLLSCYLSGPLPYV